jgi:GNAT superfamily N-acetyltransferase
MAEIKLFNGDIESLRPIANSWYETTKDNDFNLDIDIGHHLSDLLMLAAGDESDLIVLYDDDGTPVGYLGLKYFISPLSKQRIAAEHYFYVMPEKRGMASMRLIKGARFLAEQKGCSHIIFNASNLASDLHDKLCRVYEKLEMKFFESCFISEV